MREALEVTYISGDVVQVTAYYPDYVKFEERFDRNPIVVTFDAFRLTNQGFLAWAALTREERVSAPWEEWVNTVENVRIMDEVDTDLVPLEKDQPIGSLPDSQ
jgi:hypothetical protein